jgi:flagellar motor switch protein FliG
VAGESLPDTIPARASVPVSVSAPASVPVTAGGASSERLSGARKAAALLVALGSERAANVMQRLGEDEIGNISQEMARLSLVSAETTESIFGELAAVTGGGAHAATGGLDFAREVIERALGPERAADLLGQLSGDGETRPFEFLRRTPPERVAALLRGESPQTVALVLASLPSSSAAGVLARLPAGEQPEVARRIARMGAPNARVLQQVEEVIRQKLGAAREREYSATGGAKTLAGILNHADRSTERNVLEQLTRADQALADEVRGMLFVFEDIVKLDERAVQQVLREVDQKDLVLALRGAPENLMEVVLANMSERGAAMLKEEMEIQQPQRKRDVDEAQGRMVAVVRKLEQDGTIVIVGDEEEESEAVV